jgi:hypothetical protein
MIRTAKLLLIVSGLLLLVCGCQNTDGRELRVYFTCDTQGRLEPCGCFVGQFGGLTRLKTMLDEEPDSEALHVDIGDSIGGGEDYDIIQYKYMLRAFEAMKYDALNVGHREARLTAAQLRELKGNSPVPILSANLLDKATGKPVFDAYRIVQRGRNRVALVGVVDPKGLEDDLGEGLTVGSMESTLAGLLPEIRPKADLLLLLAFTEEAELVRLAHQFYEFQVILGGKVSQPAQELVRENRSIIYYVTNEARALGILQLKLASNSAPEVTGNEIRLLHDRIPQDESFIQMVNEYRDEIRRTRLAIDDPANAADDMVPGVRTAATYVGSEQCAGCHQSETDVWKRTGHAHAFATLIERKADADPKCMPCHVTGFGTFSGYQREFGNTRLVDVGCESCHGPGSLHVRQRQGDTSIDFTFRPLGAGDCQKCHYGEFSRPFKWEHFWPPIRHGTGRGRTVSSVSQ